MAFDLSLGRTSRVKSANGGGLSPLILGTFHLPEIHVTKKLIINYNYPHIIISYNIEMT